MVNEKEKITAFYMDVDTAQIFYEICNKLKLKTEHERLIVLGELIKANRIKSIIKTNKTKEEYIQHLKNKFGNVYYGSGDCNEKNEK